LANVRTQARLLDGKWRVSGQKIWTSWGLWADRIFVLARSEAGSRGPAGLSFLLLDMNQPGVLRRPIRQMTGESEFAEVFFDDAEAAEVDLIGVAGQGWSVAMALLGFERGVSTLVQQMHFTNEFVLVVEAARANGKAGDKLIRQKIADAWTGLQIMKFNALRLLFDTRSGELDGAALTSKLYWSRWHRALGDLAMEILGAAGEVGEEGYSFGALADMHLRSRADTIYAGSSQIQRNIIAERGLGLPKEPRGAL
jgi:alkylation response protein AidB-like acyl-CoA dehydrogenase